jgi:signal peptidase II
VSKRNYKILLFSIVAVVLIVDQILKIWVKTHMCLGEQVALWGNWFYLFFIENEGMAFGISLGQNFGKLLLSLLRIVVVAFLFYYILRQIKRAKTDTITVVVFSLIIAGALGNIIDSAFYGLFFSESTIFAPAVAFPEGSGYSAFLYGKVVDMFYVKLFLIPEWFPLWGGSYFFPAIFNIADACVTVGLILLLIFNGRIFSETDKQVDELTSDELKSDELTS